jgi:hypothetical protein
MYNIVEVNHVFKYKYPGILLTEVIFTFLALSVVLSILQES